MATFCVFFDWYASERIGKVGNFQPSRYSLFTANPYAYPLKPRKGYGNMLMIAEVTLLSGLAILLCVAALGDIRSYRIPNKLNLTIAALAVPYWLVHFTGPWSAIWTALWPQLILIAAAFTILLIIMQVNVLGGGDAKLLLALAFWLPVNSYLDMIMLTAIAGGLLCLGLLVVRRHKTTAPATGMNGEAVDSKLKQRIPYGVAIATGGLVPVSQLILNALMR
jgi:prepilin peptidase CpaA